MRVAVVGDLVVDVETIVDVYRMSDEAPHAVWDKEGESRALGGAAIAASFIAGTEEAVSLFSAINPEGTYRDLFGRLNVLGVSCNVAGSVAHELPRKERLRADGRTLARLDHQVARAEPTTRDQGLVISDDTQAVLVADYGGLCTLTPKVESSLAEICKRMPVVWDAHRSGMRTPPPHAIVKCTPRELAALFGHPEPDETRLPEVAQSLASANDWHVVLTRGRHGCEVWGPAGMVGRFPAAQQFGRDADAVGAGDVFSGSLAVGLGKGLELAPAVVAAVSAATTYVGVRSRRGLEAPDAMDVVGAARCLGRRLGAAAGCFDLLHAGHLDLLRFARTRCDLLVVLLNSDASVTRLKGAGRPVCPQLSRMAVLESLLPVDAVMVFDEDTPETALLRVRPDVYVKGPDYRLADLPEIRVLRPMGTEVLLAPRERNLSSSELLRRDS